MTYEATCTRLPFSFSLLPAAVKRVLVLSPHVLKRILPANYPGALKIPKSKSFSTKG